MVSYYYIILYYNIIILWDHRRICGPSTETLCGAYLYAELISVDRDSWQIEITADVSLLAVRGNGPSGERIILSHQIYIGFVIQGFCCEKNITVIHVAILHKLKSRNVHAF
jgi:hypothetical protein